MRATDDREQGDQPRQATYEAAGTSALLDAAPQGEDPRSTFAAMGGPARVCDPTGGTTAQQDAAREMPPLVHPA